MIFGWILKALRIYMVMGHHYNVKRTSFKRKIEIFNGEV
jgi:hypothetical protein